MTNVAGANRIEYLWTTPLASGSVTPTDVTNLTMSMFNGNTLVYTDTVLAGGVMQPFGGVSRVASDLQWRFNLNTMTLLEMGNLQTTNPAGGSGTQYYVTDNVTLPADSMVGVFTIINGVKNPSFTIDLLANQTSSTVPEPSTYALVGLSLAACGWLRRRAG